MSEFEKLKGGVESEISAWKSLVSGDSPLALLERVDTLKTQVDEALIYLNETQDALLAFPDLISNALELTKREVEEASASFLTTARELATALSEQATEVMERTAQSALDEFAEIRDFVTDGFLEKVKDCYESKVATVCEAGAELRDDVEEQLDEFVETTKEQVAGLTERLDEFGEEWREAVSELGDEYRNVCEKIVSLGEDVRDLTDAIDLALRGTGVGINAATQSIDDIKSIMAGIV